MLAYLQDNDLRKKLAHTLFKFDTSGRKKYIVGRRNGPQHLRFEGGTWFFEVQSTVNLGGY